MDKSAENDESTPERRSVRRRLVQSTLFQPKAQEIEFNGGDQKPDKEFEVEGDNEDDLECCGSQGKKTRKRKGKTTPQKTKVPRKANSICHSRLCCLECSAISCFFHDIFIMSMLRT